MKPTLLISSALVFGGIATAAPAPQPLKAKSATASSHLPPYQAAFAIDGKVDASDAGDMLTQRMLAHVPLLLHPAPTRAAIMRPTSRQKRMSWLCSLSWTAVIGLPRRAVAFQLMRRYSSSGW